MHCSICPSHDTRGFLQSDTSYVQYYLDLLKVFVVYGSNLFRLFISLRLYLALAPILFIFSPAFIMFSLCSNFPYSTTYSTLILSYYSLMKYQVTLSLGYIFSRTYLAGHQRLHFVSSFPSNFCGHFPFTCTILSFDLLLCYCCGSEELLPAYYTYFILFATNKEGSVQNYCFCTDSLLFTTTTFPLFSAKFVETVF